MKEIVDIIWKGNLGELIAWYSISLIMETTALKAFESRLSPSSVMIFQPFLELKVVLASPIFVSHMRVIYFCHFLA